MKVNSFYTNSYGIEVLKNDKWPKFVEIKMSFRIDKFRLFKEWNNRFKNFEILRTLKGPVWNMRVGDEMIEIK